MGKASGTVPGDASLGEIVARLITPNLRDLPVVDKD